LGYGSNPNNDEDGRPLHERRPPEAARFCMHNPVGKHVVVKHLRSGDSCIGFASAHGRSLQPVARTTDSGKGHKNHTGLISVARPLEAAGRGPATHVGKHLVVKQASTSRNASHAMAPRGRSLQQVARTSDSASNTCARATTASGAPALNGRSRQQVAEATTRTTDSGKGPQEPYRPYLRGRATSRSGRAWPARPTWESTSASNTCARATTASGAPALTGRSRQQEAEATTRTSDSGKGHIKTYGPTSRIGRGSAYATTSNIYSRATPPLRRARIAWATSIQQAATETTTRKSDPGNNKNHTCLPAASPRSRDLPKRPGSARNSRGKARCRQTPALGLLRRGAHRMR